MMRLIPSDKFNEVSMSRKKIIPILLLLMILPLYAYEGGSRDIYFTVAGARDTQPPRIMNDQLILIYKPQEPTRYIGAAFAHEDFIESHSFKINDYGVFFLIYPLPQFEEELTYRLVVDGLWMSDPTNPRIVRDRNGISLSYVNLPVKQRVGIESPKMEQNGTVTFSFRASRGEQVYLAGSFNHWDPFMYQMKESRELPGVYEITLPMRPGRYYYYFLYRGLPMTDPENLDISLDSNGREVSVLEIPNPS